MTPGPSTPATATLIRLGLPFARHRFEASPTTEGYGLEAARALGADPARVLKTLVADTEEGPVVGVVPVSATLDLKALARATGRRRAAMAEPRAAERRTGYAVGGISPLGQRTRLPLVLDAAAVVHATVLVSGGRRGFELELAPADLLAATGGTTAAIAR